jgi:hypothetical protein
MTREENLLLLDVILQDIRGNWGWGLESRVNKALELAVELNLPQFVDSINEFKLMMLRGDADGRWFRSHYKNGGYEYMEEMHGLSYTIRDKSREFQRAAVGVLTYPEYRFDDWDDSLEIELFLSE